MARIVKTAPVRRAEILSHAMTLFFSKGYEETTMNEILRSVGLSKGAFYHHFASKEELLEAFTSTLAASIAERAGSLLKEECTELERLNRLLEISTRVQHESEPAAVSAYAALFKNENVLLYQRLMTVGIDALTPLLTRIVAAGVSKGEFNVPDVSLVVEMVLQLSVTRFHVIVECVQLARDGKTGAAERLLRERLTAERGFVERLLGLPDGSLVIVDPDESRTALRALVSGRKDKSRRRGGAKAST